MLPEHFISTIREDYSFAKQYFSEGSSRNNTAVQQEKIYLVAARMLSTLGMAFGALLVASSVLSISVSPIGAAFKISLSILLFLASHDIFTMARRRTEELNNPLTEALNNVSGIFRDIGNLFTGNLPLVGRGIWAQRTQGTYLQSLWMHVISRSSQNSV